MFYGSKKGSQRLSYSEVFRFAPFALRNQPAIFLPFLVFSVIDLLLLAVLYLAPRQPFNVVLGPPIRAFWGEAYLHYPNNFLLLPQLASLSRTLLYIVAGSLLTGMAVLFVKRAYSGREAGSVWLAVSRRYVPLAGIVLLVTGVFTVFSRGMEAYFSFFFSHNSSLFLIPARIWRHEASFALNLIAGIGVQAVFVYAVPALLIENTGMGRAVLRSWVVFKRMPFATLALVSVPVLAYLPVMVLQYKTPFFVNLYPESVLYIAVAGSLINALIVDILVTVSATYLYLKKRG